MRQQNQHARPNFLQKVDCSSVTVAACILPIMRLHHRLLRTKPIVAVQVWRLCSCCLDTGRFMTFATVCFKIRGEEERGRVCFWHCTRGRMRPSLCRSSLLPTLACLLASTSTCFSTRQQTVWDCVMIQSAVVVLHCHLSPCRRCLALLQ
jgi:hypothetical protein